MSLVRAAGSCMEMRITGMKGPATGSSLTAVLLMNRSTMIGALVRQ